MDLDAEQALQFGPEQRLLGLLNHRSGDGDIACLMLNVGVTVRSGPRRLNVKLARALARQGLSSLRFDLSGIGDSGAAGPNVSYQTQAVADVRAAMDAVEAATGIRRFVVLGICSGAIHGYRCAEEDSRIVGLMMFDGYAFPDLTTRLVHDWQRLRTTPLSDLFGKLGRRLRKWLGAPVQGAPVSIFYASRDETSPDRHRFAATLDALAARGVGLLIVYSGSLLALHNHRSQFERVFKGRRFLALTDHRYLPHIDHIPTAQVAQAEFVQLVTDWTQRLRLTCIR